MKVYFSASRFYAEIYQANYDRILAVLRKNNLEIIENSRLKHPKGYFKTVNSLKVREELYEEMIRNIEEADFCVFEASHPSTVNIGHEITVALDRCKPTVVAYTKDKDPILFRGIKESRIIWVEYINSTLEDEMEEAICQAKECLNIRFNFFVTPKILTYLNKIAKEKNIPRSVYLRELIEKDMENAAKK